MTQAALHPGRPRWPARLAWALWMLTVLGLLATAWLDRLLRQAGRPELTALPTSGVPLAVAEVSAVTVGAVLAGRRPAHPVGWLLVLRFGRSRGTERQQLRWLAWGAALASAALVVAIAGLVLDNDFTLLNLALGVCAALLPLATGAAILRYRLYDLDRIISRTLAWTLLTLLLALAYAAVVLGLGRLLPQGPTLAVAAAFQPARRRIQQAVDRRFNRRRHDAARLIEAFGARLRDQVDLDALHTELLAVVDQTMQPTRASLWLRPPAGPGRLRAWAQSVGRLATHSA